jgi:hypothetical protein
LSQDVLKGVGGEVSTEFLGGRPASCTFRLVGSNGTELQAEGPATVDPVATTLSAPAAAGAVAVTLTSAVGVETDGRRYLLDGEDVTIKSLSGATATLWAPLLLAHAAGATFEGVTVTATIDAVTAADEFWDARGIFTPLTGPRQTEAINCASDVIPRDLIGLQDIRDANPNPQMAVSKELNLARSLRFARDEAVMMIGTETRAAKHIGVAFFRPFAALVWWCQRRPEFGENWAPELDRIETRRDQLKAMALGQSPVASGEGTIPGPGGAIPPNFNLAAF